MSALIRRWPLLVLLPLVASCAGIRPPHTVEGDLEHPGNGVAGGTTETIPLDDGTAIDIQHGPLGDPALMGCADGTREAFLDTAAFPAITGCMASWEGQMSLRLAGTGRACGDGATCATPADACAPGWHVCAASGALAELLQVSAEQCEQAGSGRYVAAVSHCKDQSGCEYDESPNAHYDCFDSGWCSEPVCCGADCGELGTCTSGVWPGRTHIPVGTDQGCGMTTSERAGGVLCCRD